MITTPKSKNKHRNWLDDLAQRVAINGWMFKWWPVKNCFPQGSALGPKAFFQRSSMCQWHWDQVPPQPVHRWHQAVWPLMCLREGMPSRGPGQTLRVIPCEPPPTPPAVLCPALGAQHRKLMDLWEQGHRRPTKKSHRASGYEHRLREQPMFTMEKRSLRRGLPEAFPYMALGDL